VAPPRTSLAELTVLHKPPMTGLRGRYYYGEKRGGKAKKGVERTGGRGKTRERMGRGWKGREGK